MDEYSLFFLVLVFSSAFSIAYCFLIIYIWKKAENPEPREGSQTYVSDDFISVLIPVKNEEEHIKDCLLSISNNDYPKSRYEIIVINDHSSDRTVECIEELNLDHIKVLHLKDFISPDDSINSYKKLAIQIAHREAKGNIIMQTDGDCLVPKSWLSKTAYNFQERKVDFQTGRISYQKVKGILQVFQDMDVNVMMEITHAGIKTQNWYLANGANMAYRKSILPASTFAEAKEFASGDDVFLINTLSKDKNIHIHFEPFLVVSTYPEETLSGFIAQRIRWAGKNRALLHSKISNILLFPSFYNLYILLLFGLSFFFPNIFLIFLFSFIVKLGTDQLLIFKRNEYKNPFGIASYLISCMLYPIYIVGIGLLSFIVKRYKWKGRSVT